MHEGMIWQAFVLVGGLYLLVKGADHLVDGATSLALHLGVRPIVVGLTVVAFGTSAPELAATVASLLDGQQALALGNVIGSNICNLTLILGFAAVLTPLVVERRLVRREFPFLVILTLLVAGLCYRGDVGRLGGGLILLAFFSFCGSMAALALSHRRDKNGNGNGGAVGVEEPQAEMSCKRAWVFVVLGLIVLTVGARLLVWAAEELALGLGVSPEVIGLTIVALGTSLPELATTLAAARKSAADLALGNVIGSNIFNIGLVIGVPSMFFEWPVDWASFDVHVIVMVVLTLIVVGCATFRRGMGRWMGVFLLLSYVAYQAFVMLTAK